jgi:hypothetical protein
LIDAVIGRDHEHDDVGDVGPAGPHLGEGLVAGRVNEGDDALLVTGADRNLEGARRLRDAARLAGGDVGVPYLVQQRGLAVIDVPQDGHHRASRLLVDHLALRELLNDLLLAALLLDDVELDLVFEHDLDGGVGVDGGVQGDLLAGEEQLLDDVPRPDAGGRGQVLDGDRLFDPDLAPDLRRGDGALTASGGAPLVVAAVGPEEPAGAVEPCLALPQVLRPPVERLVRGGGAHPAHAAGGLAGRGRAALVAA